MQAAILVKLHLMKNHQIILTNVMCFQFLSYSLCYGTVYSMVWARNSEHLPLQGLMRVLISLTLYDLGMVGSSIFFKKKYKFLSSDDGSFMAALIFSPKSLQKAPLVSGGKLLGKKDAKLHLSNVDFHFNGKGKKRTNDTLARRTSNFSFSCSVF